MAAAYARCRGRIHPRHRVWFSRRSLPTPRSQVLTLVFCASSSARFAAPREVRSVLARLSQGRVRYLCGTRP